MEQNFPVPERVKSELSQLVDNVWLYVEPTYKEYFWRIPKDKFERARAAVFYSHKIPDSLEKYKFLTLYEINSGCYWHATDYWDKLKEGLAEEDLKFYANAIIELAKVGGCHKNRGSDYAWIVLKHYDGTLENFIDEGLLREAVNRGFWEFAERELTGCCQYGSLKYYQAIMAYKDLIKIEKIPIKRLLKATLLEKRDIQKRGIHGYNIKHLWWPDKNYIQLVNKFKDRLPKDDSAKLIRPILELGILAALNDEFEGDREKELKKWFEPYKEYLECGHIQDLFKHYISQLADGLDTRFEFLLPYWNASEEHVKEFISEKVKGAWVLEFLSAEFPTKYLTNDLLQKLQEKLLKELSEQQKWDKSIVPNINSWDAAVRLGYIPESDAKEFVEGKIQAYLSRKRVSKVRLAELYHMLPSFVSAELKEEIRTRAGAREQGRARAEKFI